MLQNLDDPTEPATGLAVDEEARSVARARRKRRALNRRRAVYEWVVAVVVAVVVAFVIKTWVAQTFVIPSGSMENTLLQQDRVLVSKLSFPFGDPERGDVLVFDNPECEGAPSSCQYQQLIKRVVGVAGDTVTAADGKLIVNGVVEDPKHLKPGATTALMVAGCSRFEAGAIITVGPGQLLMMGDNRQSSHDGRCFGPISATSVVGKAFVRVWPLDRLGGL